MAITGFPPSLREKISELPDGFFVHKGVRYKVISGADAILLFDWEGWKTLARHANPLRGEEWGQVNWVTNSDAGLVA